MRSDRAELAEWLRRRVGLLVDVNELVAHRPVLAEVFGTDGPGPAETAGSGDVGTATETPTPTTVPAGTAGVTEGVVRDTEVGG